MKCLWVAAVVVSMLTIAGPAHAQDRRPCVSKVEYRQAVIGETYRADLEAEWESTPLADTPPSLIEMAPMSSRSYLVYYKRCGFSTDESWFAVEYRVSDDRLASKMKMRRGDATLHGHA